MFVKDLAGIVLNIVKTSIYLSLFVLLKNKLELYIRNKHSVSLTCCP